MAAGDENAITVPLEGRGKIKAKMPCVLASEANALPSSIGTLHSPLHLYTKCLTKRYANRYRIDTFFVDVEMTRLDRKRKIW
jgi:hypothetical protein